jgi:hypothetical protein
MKKDNDPRSSSLTSLLDRRLAAYVAAAGGAATLMSSPAEAVVVAHTVDQPFGINGVVGIDYNLDGQTDFQIDHDRVDMTAQAGPVVDYLQIDKNDVNGEGNPLDFDPLTDLQAMPFQDGTSPRNDTNQSTFLIQNPGSGANIEYPSALEAGAEIGPLNSFDYQEGDNVYSTGQIGRMGRLIDEDHGQVDMILGGKTAEQIVTPANTPQFVGLQNQVRYLGVRMDLNNASENNTAEEFTYGWIGVRIDNEADATGVVTGWAYETVAGAAITAGNVGTPTGHGDYDGDGDSDGNDFLLWQRLLGGTATTPGTGADGDGSGQIDAADLGVWKGNFGFTATAAAPVPEPALTTLGATGALASLGWLASGRRRRTDDQIR